VLLVRRVLKASTDSLVRQVLRGRLEILALMEHQALTVYLALLV